MTRLTDPAAATGSNSPLAGVPITDDRANAVSIRDAVSAKQVCPFCGSQNIPPANNANGSSGPCPRCTMEDSAATRQATKARIGPWHVLQTRNPAAPGMRYATLLALVGKGQVTARSVVRGPTTHQLWRYAAHVKGLSREFGVCYSCGEPIGKTASHCPHCDRAQEPAGNPDALLETREPVVAAQPAAVAMNAALSPLASPLAQPIEAGVPESYPLVSRPAVPSPILSHAERLRVGEPRPEQRRRADGKVLSAMDLAAALQVSPPPPEPAGHPVRTVFFTLIVVGLLACGIIGYARPDLRSQAIDWGQNAWARASQALGNFHLQSTTPTDSETTPGYAPSLPTASDLNVPGVSPAGTPSEVTPTHDGAASGPSVQPNIQITPGGSTAPNVAPVTPPSGSPAMTATTDQDQSPTAHASLMPDHPVLIGPALSSSEIWQLHKQGLDAESRHDWAAAVHAYEQIEAAPSDQWPSDVKIRLANAKRQMGQ